MLHTEQITELRQKRHKLVEDARKLYDEACARDGGATEEDEAKLKAQLDDAGKLERQADNLERLDEAEKKSIEARDRILESPESGAPKDEKKAKEALEEARCRVFEAYLAGGDEKAREQAAVEARALQADSDTLGGYTFAPAQFVARLIKAVDNDVFFRRLATIIPVTSSDEIIAPSLDADPADPAWTAEVGAVSEDSTMAFGKRSLKPYQLTKLIKVSDKLLMISALPIEQLVRERLAYKFSVTEENIYLNGTGAAQPLGVFVASANGISTGRDVSTGNSTTAIGADGLIEAKYSLKGQHQRASEWIFHRDAVKNIVKLKDGEGRYMWQTSIQAGQPDMLIGRPVNMSEYAPNTFTTGLYVGILGNFSAGYWIAEMQAMRTKRLVELYAANGQVGFIGTRWLDGMPVLEEAFARVTLA